MPASIAALAELLAATLRNVGIYPAGHPRVVVPATELLARLHQKAEGLTTMVYSAGEQIVFDRVPIPTSDSRAAWLLQRFREAAMRGVEFAHDCTAEDVIGFAQALHTTQSRRGSRDISAQSKVGLRWWWVADPARMDVASTRRRTEAGPQVPSRPQRGHLHRS